MSRQLRLIAVLVAVAMIGASSVPAFAAAPGAGSLGALLPVGETLNDDELSRVEGEGLGTAAGMGVTGFISGFISYTAGVIWDRVVEGKDTAWDAGEATKAAVSGAVGGFVAGLLVPVP